jgi:hypothetical protein
MDNMKIKVEGSELVIRVALDHVGSITKGNNMMLGTTDSWFNVNVDGETELTVNCAVVKKLKTRRRY